MIRPRRLAIILLFLAGIMFVVRVRQSARRFRGSPLNAPESLLATPSSSSQSPAAPLPKDLPYKLDAGPYQVGEIKQVVLHDAKRNKDLKVHIYYPDAVGTFPVVVFSHGAGGSGNCCDKLPKHWTGYGYVVLAPTHADSVELRRENGEDLGVVKGMLEAVASIVRDPSVLPNRVSDITFLLDSLDEIARQQPQVGAKFDRTRIGMSGHSLGSMTTQLIGGATFGLNPGPHNFADGRVRAIEILSGGGRLNVGQNEHSWDNIHVPTLALTGSLDPGSVIAGPGFTDGRKQVFDFLPPGDKYNVYLEGANHMAYIGYGKSELFNYVEMATLAFWDAYLKGDASAREWLASDALASVSSGDAKLSRK